MNEKARAQTPIRRFFHSRLFLIVGLIVVFLVAFGYARAYYQDYKIREEISQLEQEVHDLETKKLESLEILKYVTSDAFVEEKARTELNMKKPGEQVAIIKQDTNETPDRMRESQDGERHLSNPVKWWYYFTHRTP